MGLFQRRAFGDTAIEGYFSQAKPSSQALKVVHMEGVRSYGAFGPHKRRFDKDSADHNTAASVAQAGSDLSGTSHQNAVTN